MKPPKYKSRVIVPHIKGCNSDFCGILDDEMPTYYGNFAANIIEGSSNHHLWYRTRCNNIECNAIKAVHSYVLETA